MSSLPQGTGLTPPEIAVDLASAPSLAGSRGVIFFDGVCGLCNRWVDFVMRRDPIAAFRFSPLQGETARDWLNIRPDEPLNSIVLVDAEGPHRKTDAIIRILRGVGGPWRVAALLLSLLPRPVRNLGYDLVAKNRYHWFGKKESCRLPSAAERERFLP